MNRSWLEGFSTKEEEGGFDCGGLSELPWIHAKEAGIEGERNEGSIFTC